MTAFLASLSPGRGEGQLRAVHLALSVVAAVAYRGMLDFVYLRFVSFTFAYMRLVFLDNPRRALESYGLVVAAAALLALLCYNDSRSSRVVAVFLFAFLFVPLTSLFALGDAPRPFVYACFGCFVLMVIGGAVLPSLRLPGRFHSSPALGYTLGILVTGCAYGLLLASGGLGRLSFDVTTVYEVREAYGESSNVALGYLLPLQAKVINLTILIYGLLRRRWRWVAAALALQVLLFGMTNFRGYALAPVFVGAVFFLARVRFYLPIALAGMSAIVAGAYAVSAATDNIYVASLFVRRLLFIPARNHVLYYDWFSNNELVMLSNSILSWLFKYPYDLPVPRMISIQYFGVDGRSNVGFLGDAYAHFGIPGMIGFTALLVLILRLIDGTFAELPRGFAVAALGLSLISVVNSALFTVLATHGLLLGIAWLWLLRDRLAAGTLNPSERVS